MSYSKSLSMVAFLFSLVPMPVPALADPGPENSIDIEAQARDRRELLVIESEVWGVRNEFLEQHPDRGCASFFQQHRNDFQRRHSRLILKNVITEDSGIIFTPNPPILAAYSETRSGALDVTVQINRPQYDQARVDELSTGPNARRYAYLMARAFFSGPGISESNSEMAGNCVRRFLLARDNARRATLVPSAAEPSTAAGSAGAAMP